jgi:hypothetical protein
MKVLIGWGLKFFESGSYFKDTVTPNEKRRDLKSTKKFTFKFCGFSGGDTAL